MAELAPNMLMFSPLLLLIHTFKFSLQYLIKNTTLLLDFSVLKVLPGPGKKIGLSVKVIIRQYTSGMAILCYQ